MWTQVDQRIRRALAGIRQGYRALTVLCNTKGPVMIVQLDALEGETVDAEYFQHFGLTSIPPKGAQAVVLPIGGVTGHSVVIATEHGSYRIKTLKEGETAIYNQDGAVIHLKRGKVISVECDTYEVKCKNYAVNASSSAAFTTPDLTASAKISAKGIIKSDVDVQTPNTSQVKHTHKVGSADSTPPIPSAN